MREGNRRLNGASSVRQQLCRWEGARCPASERDVDATRAAPQSRRGAAAANEQSTQRERAMRVDVELEGILSCAYMQLLGRETVI